MMNSGFRKTSQSLYQPGQNKSAVGNGKFNATLEGSGMMGKSGVPGLSTFVTDSSEEDGGAGLRERVEDEF